MANPFFVGNSVSDSLVGLGNVIGQKFDEQQAIEDEAAAKEVAFQKQQAMQKELQDAMASGDVNQIAAVSMKYPDISKGIQDTFKFKNDITKENFNQSMREIVSGGDVEEILTSRIAQVQSQGGDPTQSMQELANYQENPEGYVDTVEKTYAMSDPDGYKKFKDAFAKESTKFAQGAGDMSGYAFNPQTGEYKINDDARASIEKSAAEKKSALESKSKSEQAKVRQGINKDFTTMIKGAVEANRAAKNLEKLNETSSPTDQLAAIFSFMKALDPTSVVREGEQDMARSTGGPTDSFIGAINQIKGEGGLTPEAFKNLVNTAKSVSDSAVNSVTFDANSYLDSYEDTLTSGFKGLLKKRIPKPFDTARKASKEEILSGVEMGEVMETPNDSSAVNWSDL